MRQIWALIDLVVTTGLGFSAIAFAALGMTDRAILCAIFALFFQRELHRDLDRTK